MKIQTEVEVFPDPEYCEKDLRKKSYQSCQFLNDNICKFFHKKVYLHNHPAIKCKECKEAYQKAVESDKQEIKPHNPTYRSMEDALKD